MNDHPLEELMRRYAEDKTAQAAESSERVLQRVVQEIREAPPSSLVPSPRPDRLTFRLLPWKLAATLLLAAAFAATALWALRPNEAGLAESVRLKANAEAQVVVMGPFLVRQDSGTSHFEVESEEALLVETPLAYITTSRGNFRLSTGPKLLRAEAITGTLTVQGTCEVLELKAGEAAVWTGFALVKEPPATSSEGK
jgi:hypothetical protein